jgi:hypothetical protein
LGARPARPDVYRGPRSLRPAARARVPPEAHPVWQTPNGHVGGVLRNILRLGRFGKSVSIRGQKHKFPNEPILKIRKSLSINNQCQKRISALQKANQNTLSA